MPTDYDFIPNLDPMELDRRLSIVLGEEFNPGSPNLDPIEIDRRIATAPPPPVPPGPTPIDYKYGSINYKEEFATVPENSIRVKDGKVLISFKAAWKKHGLFCFRMYIPEEFLKILVEYDTRTFTGRNTYYTDIYFGYPFEALSMFLWDPSRDFSTERIGVGDWNARSSSSTGVLVSNELINIPPELIQTFYDYTGYDDLRFEKRVWHSLKQLNGGVYEDPEVITFYSFFSNYNKTTNGFFGVALDSYQVQVNPERYYPPQKQVVMMPPAGFSYIFSGLRNPLGYRDWIRGAMTTTAVFRDGWLYEGTDGELGRVAAGQPFPDEVADHIPEEWNTL